MSDLLTARTARIVRAFLESEYYDGHRWGSSSDMWLDDPDRADRCDAAAAHGADGSYYAEVIDDYRRLSREWLREKSRAHDGWHDGYPRIEAMLKAHWNEVEAWHEAQGTLWQEVG